MPHAPTTPWFPDGRQSTIPSQHTRRTQRHLVQTGPLPPTPTFIRNPQPLPGVYPRAGRYFRCPHLEFCEGFPVCSIRVCGVVISTVYLASSDKNRSLRFPKLLRGGHRFGAVRIATIDPLPLHRPHMVCSRVYDVHEILQYVEVFIVPAFPNVLTPPLSTVC